MRAWSAALHPDVQFSLVHAAGWLGHASHDWQEANLCMTLPSAKPPAALRVTFALGAQAATWPAAHPVRPDHAAGVLLIV